MALLAYTNKSTTSHSSNREGRREREGEKISKDNDVFFHLLSSLNFHKKVKVVYKVFWLGCCDLKIQ